MLNHSNISWIQVLVFDLLQAAYAPFFDVGFSVYQKNGFVVCFHDTSTMRQLDTEKFFKNT